jgi:hypothetical protein
MNDIWGFGLGSTVTVSWKVYLIFTIHMERKSSWSAEQLWTYLGENCVGVLDVGTAVLAILLGKL